MNLITVLKAQIPLVSARTTDLMNLEEVLKEIQDKKIKKYKEGHKLKKDELYYCIGGILEVNLHAVYAECIQAGTTLIIINPNPDHNMYFDIGEIQTPSKLLYEELSDVMSENDFKEILPALGGLTMKDSVEILMITEAEHGYSDSDTVMRTRLKYYRSTQGLDIVDTDIKGYMPDSRLEGYTKYEKEFFLGDYDTRLRPRGLLVHGIPGTGKTSGAKYIAREWKVPLFRLDATVQSKWLGESEANLTQALKTIEQHGPCILLIDEAEKLFSKGSDSGVSEKLLATMLWWMQEHRAQVFTYMTCNDLEKLPIELQRAGRIDNVMVFKKINPDSARELSIDILRTFDGYSLIPPEFVDSITGADVFKQTIATIKREIKRKCR